MATTVDTLVVRIEADMKDMRRALRRVEADVSKSTSKMGGAFKKLGGAMKLALAAVAVRQAFIAGKAMIDLASDIEEMQGKSKVVFGEFRKGVVLELSAFGDAVGRSSHELEGMASTVQDTFVPMGFARGEAAKLSVELTKLAVDTASFNNASDTDTMNAFQSALVGNHETVRRFGVVITEATLNQELLTMGIEGGTKAATNAQKVQARLNLITDGVKDAQGDAARTAESYANQMKGLRGEFSELVGALGEKFLPMLVSVIKTLRNVTERVKAFLQSMDIIDTPLSDAMKNTQTQINKTKDALQDLQLRMSESVLMAQGKNNIDQVIEYKNEIEALTLQLIRLKQESLPSKGTGAKRVFNPEDINSLIGTAGATSNAGDTTSTKKTPAELLEEARQEQLKTLRELIPQQERLVEINKRENLAKETGSEILLQQFERARDIFNLKQKFPLLSIPELKQQLDLLQAIRDKNIETQKSIDLADKEKQDKDKAQEKLNASIERGIVLGKEHHTVKEEMKQQSIDLMNAFNDEEISYQQLMVAMEKIKEKKLELDPVYAQMKDRIQSTADAMTDSLTQMVLAGKINFDTMKDMFKDMVRQMIADALKAQVIKPLLGAVFGGIGGAIGGNVGTAFTAVGTNLNKAATGGSLQRGNPYLVGERGPELIVPSSAGTIMNNHNTKNALGGGGGTVVNQTINVQSGVAQTVRAEMISLLPRFKQDTMNAVVDAKRRGGAFGQAFG